MPINRVKKLLNPDGFLGQASKIAVLTIVGQLAYFLAGPIISRIYTPEEVGLYGLTLFLYILLCGGLSFFFDMSISSTLSDRKANRISYFCYKLGMFSSGLGSIVFAILILLNISDLGKIPLWFVLVFFVGLIIQNCIQIFNYVLVRNGNVVVIAESNLLLNFCRGFIQVTGGFLTSVSLILMGAEIIGRFFSLIYLQRKFAALKLRFQNWKYDYVIFKSELKTAVAFFPSYIADSLAVFLQSLIVGAYFGATEMGIYFMMRRTLDMPIAFITRALSDLIFSKQVNLSKTSYKLLKNFHIKITALLLLLGFLMLTPVVIWGEELFSFVYGSDWSNAGKMAAIMVPGYLISIAVVPSARIFAISRKQHLRLYPSIFNLLSTVFLSLYLYAFNLDLWGLIIAFSIIMSTHYLIYFGVSYIAMINSGKSFE
ncbi:hypothetical protein LPB140_06450 [Sphingorhabdus lutea]|uniref:Polysaccharide biosynthesis protein n=1 Tax=Sphingorhabdus lutea TaxID=1913578 RepID=A0A1L3JBG9_9SPHN|nr:oligosaccharide flippase family protein [Sphingorhabdus lutea]APG62485.1 hypothetical protein LPB140_06450 [Sphingorhabdus lutea]